MSSNETWKVLQVCKKGLQVSDATYIDNAQKWSKDLTRMKARGPGDTENAMRQIEREYGIDYGFLWSLRYRRDRLKVISVSVYERIAAAYRAECERQMRKLQHEISITPADHVATAEALVRETIAKGAAAQGEVTK